MKNIRIALLLIIVLVSLSVTAPSRASDLEPQSIKSQSDWLLDTEAGVPFWIARNAVGCNNVPVKRLMFVFMEPRSFSAANLTKVFRYLADKFVKPGSLEIFVRTDPVVLQKWMDLYTPLAVPLDERRIYLTDGMDDQVYEETKIGSYQAEFFRYYGSEFFSYSPDTKTGARRKVRLSNSYFDQQNSSDLNADLLTAAWKRSVDRVNRLLDEGAEVNWKNKYGLTPLMAAVYMRRFAIVKLLLDRGANINVNDYDGWTPLLCAANSPFGERLAIELVRRGADVNAKTQCGDSVLILATKWEPERPDLVEELLNKGADFTAKDRFGRTPLQIAEKRQHHAIINLLKKKAMEK